ncbi:MAG: enoyl-CoA hydratase/isomerase family protein [Egibacteraceae bacterium]
MEDQTSYIAVEQQDAVRVVTLDRPERLNAWHAPMRAELVAALRAGNADDATRALVVTGAGERAFSAGQDLDETMQFDADRAGRWIDEWRELYGTIRHLDLPLVAAVNGVCVGSAFQFALLADVRVGHPNTRMGQPEIDSGIPSTLGPWAMWEILGRSRTIELTLTGRLMDGEECHRLGVLHHLVAPEQVLPTAIEVAAGLAAKPRVAMRLNKRHFRQLTEASFEAALAAGSAIQAEAFGTGEPQQMMATFFARRNG